MTRAEDFSEPLMVEDDGASLPKGAELELELAEARRAISERDRTIQLLAERLESLESLESLRAPGSESVSQVRALHSMAPNTERSGELVDRPSRKGSIAQPPALPSRFPPLADPAPAALVVQAVPPSVRDVLPARSASLGAQKADPLDHIQWHSVTVGRRPSQAPDSVPPSQRKDPRRAIELQIEFNEDTQFFAGLTQDVSEGGVFIATYRIQPIGTPLTVSFELPGGTKISARGQVRWIRDTNVVEGRPGMGVAFTDIGPECLSAVAEFCRRIAPLYVEF